MLGRSPARRSASRGAPFALVRALAVLLIFTAGLAAQTEAPPASPEAPALPDGAPDGTSTIVAEDLERHARYLASDELGGRYTGSTGQVAAAEYIKNHFEQLGLEPLGDKVRGKQGFFQAWPAHCTRLEAKDTYIQFGSGKDSKRTRGFAVVKGPDELARIRLSGRFVFCADGSPRAMPSALGRTIPVVRLGGGGDLQNAQLGALRAMQRVDQICDEAASRGAPLVVFLTDGDPGFADSLNYRALLPDKPLLRFGNGPVRFAGPFDVPAFFLDLETSNALLAHMGVAGDEQQDRKASGKIGLHVVEDERFEALNVCAVLPGADRSLAGEAVVFSAHMDHMGTRLDGDAFNGADDNASGTSGLLEIAEAFARGERPPRSVVFLAVSGEELGLWGSEYYADNPTWDPRRIVANVNIDMIGRVASLSGEKGISITPSPSHEAFSTLVRTAAECAAALDVSLSSGDTYYERSDHYNFAKKGIPVVFFCDGEHDDYHKVTDEPDRLDFQKMQLVARLAYWTGHRVASAEERPRTLGKQDGWLPGGRASGGD
jgi:hypothetical protein